MVSAYLAELTIRAVESVGSRATEKLFQKFKNWPTSSEDAGKYYQSIKQATIADLRDVETILQRSLSLLMKRGDMETHDSIARLRTRIEQLRDDINKSGSDTVLSAVKEDDILRAISMIYLTLQYETYVTANEANLMFDALEFGGDYKAHYRDMVTALRNLETTWRMRTKANTDPASALAIFDELKGTRKEWIELIEKMGEESLGQMNQLMSGVVLKKPRLFGKARYREALGEIVWTYTRTNNITKIELPELELHIKGNNQSAEFDQEDLEEAINVLIAENKAYALGMENNIKYAEFRKTDESRICDRCGKHGGIYEEYYECQNLKKLVCDDCISFFKKCKICGESIKTNHPKKN